MCNMSTLYLCFRFRSDPTIICHLKEQEESVMASRLTPGAAADNLLQIFIRQ